MNDPSITFPHSGLTGDILKLFSKPIAKFVQAALNSIGCDYLKNVGSKSITAGLQAIDGFIAPYMRPPPAIPLPAAAAGVEDLRRSATAVLVNYGANELLGANINKIMG